MNNSVRLITLAGFAVALAGCESDVKPVGDALAQDSTLALEVFGARPDSATDLGDTANAELDSSTIATSQPASEAELSAPITPAATVASSQSPRVETSAPSPRRASAAPARRNSSRRVAESPSRRTASRSTAVVTRRSSSATSGRVATSSRRDAGEARVNTGTSSSIASAQPVAPSRGWLILPAGAVLEFEAGRQICANTSDDAFDATLSEDVVRADGVVVPDGTAARGSIIANTTGSGTKPGVTIEWLTFNGRMYAVKTRVTETDTKNVRTRTGTRNTTKVAAGAATGAAIGGIIGRDAKGALIGAAGGAIAGAVAGARTPRTYTSCIPDGGRIVAELTEPLRIALSE
jgi:hypothetical protein